MKERERPSKHGKILGESLSLLAAAGRKDAPMEIPECCLTCAFRPGCMTNQMAATGKTALDCVLGIDPDRFACHHGMKDGQPSKICVGYIAARLAPWSFTKDVLIAMQAELDKIDGSPDEVRAAFDAWWAQCDPQQDLDVYQQARAFASR